MESRATVTAKVTDYVNRVFQGDWRKAFDHHDSNADGKVSFAEMNGILAAAGVGYRLTRAAVSAQIMTVMDADGDGSVTFAEFNALAHVASS